MPIRRLYASSVKADVNIKYIMWRRWTEVYKRQCIDKGVTSLQKELGHEVSMEEVKERLCKELVNLLS